MEASVYFYTDPATNRGVWRFPFDIPVVNSLDNDALKRDPKLFLSYNSATVESKNIDLNTSVNILPTGTSRTALDVNADTLQNPANIRFRHNRGQSMNVLMADGHVETFSYNKKKSSQAADVTNFKRRFIYVNQNS